MKPDNPSARILITNIVSLNTGDAAILWGTMQILKQKYGSNIEIHVFDKEAKIAQRHYPWATFHQSLFIDKSKNWIWKRISKLGYEHWRNRIKYYRYITCLTLLRHKFFYAAKFLLSRDEYLRLKLYMNANLILSTGGTYLTENYDLNPAIYDYRLTMHCGNLYGFFTQTLGPFTNPKYRTQFKKIFSSSSITILRDQRSKKHLLELGVSPENIYLAADAAFVFTGEDASKIKKNSGSQIRNIAISARSMNFFHHKNNEQGKLGYYDCIRKIINIAVKELDLKVTFLSTCQGIPEYWTNDADTADEIYASLPPSVRENVTIDRSFRQPAEIMEAYKNFDLVVATRMHAAILSMCAGTPTIGLAYEFKIEELYSILGLEELALKVGDLTENEISECIHNIYNKHIYYSEKLNQVIKRMHQSAISVSNYLPELKRKI